MGKSLTIDRQETDNVRKMVREKMPVTQRWAYFDHAAVAPIPLPTREAIEVWLRQASEEGDTCWPQWAEGTERLRTNAATLLHCERDEIALVPNTSTGISLIAEGFGWQPGDNLVIPDNEFPSNSLPWQHLLDKGVETRRVPAFANGSFQLDAIAQAIDSRTRMISLSWVGFSSGFRVPLDQICDLAESKGVSLFLDAIQGLGVFPLDLSRHPIDFVAADGHKWMLGPEGAGLLFVRKKWIDRIRPSITGWGSVQQSWKFSAQELEWKSNASRFEAGSANMVGLIGFNASLEMLLGLGCHLPNNQVAQVVLENANCIEESLRNLGAKVELPESWDNRSGIVSFELPGKDHDAMRQHLLKRGVVLSVRQGKLRASTHVYNNQSDINRLIEHLED